LELGVAFAFVEGNEVRGAIQPVLDWPGRRIEQKVSSEISYSPALGGERQWGYDINENSLKWRWTKLELDQQERPDELRLLLEAVIGMANLDVSKVDQSNGQALAYSKTPERIVADYLSHVREHLVRKLRVEYPDTFTILAIDLVVTVPAVCLNFIILPPGPRANVKTRFGRIGPKIEPVMHLGMLALTI